MNKEELEAILAEFPADSSKLWSAGRDKKWKMRPEGKPLLERARELFPPSDIGPLWQKDTFGQWLLPEITLGWEVLGWTAEWLTNADGTPWKFTPEQARLILWIFAIDKRGDWLYQQAVYQALKGAGKDPFAAVMSIIHLIGPCHFSHFDRKTGKPVAKDDPEAWVQIAAVSKDQTKNTMKFFAPLLPKRTREHFQLDVQKEIIYAFHGQRTLEAIASGFRSAEGNRATWATMNETQHWIKSQGGHDLYDTIGDNILKTGGRFICITNAYEPGENSVAEIIRDEQEKVWAGLTEPSGWLYCSREAHPDSPLDVRIVPFILELIRGDAKWLPIPKITLKTQDGSKGTSRIRRMFYNQVVASEDALYTPAEWEAIRVKGLTGTKADLNPGDEITMGFDGGKTDDATALVAIRIRDKLIVPLAVWQKPEGPKGENWEVNKQEVDSEVHEAFATYKVRAFFADLALWDAHIDSWADDYRELLLVKASGAKHTIAFDMRANEEVIARTNEALLQTVLDKKIFHNGDKNLKVHTLNAKRSRNRKGLTFRKDNPESPRKVDLYAAAFLAFMALQRLAESGKKPDKQYRRRLVQT